MSKIKYEKTYEMYEDICEYFYNKGYISGLEKAKSLDENKIDALIKIYAVKTKYFDNLLSKNPRDSANAGHTPRVIQ